MPNPAQWLREARWGLLIHFLAKPPSSPEAAEMTADEWNEYVNGFDVERAVEQVKETAAGYYILTIGQNTGFYCSPNETYDRIVGHDPPHTSRRDLIGEMADALDAAGVRAMAYLPSHAAARDRQAAEALVCTPDWDASQWQLRPGTYFRAKDTDRRLSEFQRNWEAVIREWSERWGRKIHGWWIDGCYYADTMYRHDDAPNFASFAAALKAGNPDSIVACNPGVKMPIIRHSASDDYTAGEVNDLPAWFRHRSTDGTVDGAQLQVLSFLGEYWCGGAPRFPDELAVGYTKYVNQQGGAMTWDVPIDRHGIIPEAFMKQLRQLGR